MKINRNLLFFIAAAKKQVAVKILLLVMISYSYILQAFTMGKAVNVIFSGGGAGLLWPCVLTALLAVTVRSLVFRFLEGYSAAAGSLVKARIRNLVFEKITRLGPGYVMDIRSGRLQSIMMEGIENLQPYLLDYFPQICAMAVSGLSICVLSLILDPVVGLVLVVTLIV